MFVFCFSEFVNYIVLWNRNEAFKIRRPSVTLFRRKNHNLNDRILLRYWFCIHGEISTVKTFQIINITCNISSFIACDEITIIATWTRLLLSKIAFHLPSFNRLFIGRPMEVLCFDWGSIKSCLTNIALLIFIFVA